MSTLLVFTFPDPTDPTTINRDLVYIYSKYINDIVYIVDYLVNIKGDIL